MEFVDSILKSLKILSEKAGRVGKSEALPTVGAEKADDAAAEEIYTSLKQLLQQLFREKPVGLVALDQYEKKPEIWEAPLKDSLLESGADKDENIVRTLIKGSQIGVLGNDVKIEGGIHFGERTDIKSNGDAVYVKDQATSFFLKNVTIQSPADPDYSESLSTYRRLLINSLQHLSLRGLSKEESDPSGDQKRLELYRIYIDPDTKTQVWISEMEKNELYRIDVHSNAKTQVWEKKKSKEYNFVERDEKPRPLSALEAAKLNRKLVILGDPGSGKSTFVNHLALCLASHDAAEVCLTDRLAYWDKEECDLIPVHVVLRDFAGQIPDKKKADASVLWEFVTSRLKAQKLDFAEKALEDALNRGKAIVILDGLDEIPTKEKRTFVRDSVAAFAERFDKCRFVVTCRVLSYQYPEWKLNEKDFPVFELAPFDKKKTDAFISAWYEDLFRLKVIKTEEEKNILARRLKTAVRRPYLWRLASNPLLLTVMALVHTYKGRLPDTRALLYEETTEILLWRWEQVKTGERDLPRLQELLRQAGRAEVDLKKLLRHLAYEAHSKTEGNRDGLADIKEWDLEKALAALHPGKSKDWADQVIRTIKMRAGLLIEREPEVYSFPHRTFQEYLAGSHLSLLPEFAAKASELAESGNYWREVILLAVGRLVHVSEDYHKPLALAGELCPEETEHTDAGWRKVWLAGEVLNETGMNRVQDSRLGRDLAKRIRNRLAELIETGQLEPKERVAAGNVLANIGDPRFDPELFYLPKDKDLGFVKIEAGEFWMGSDKKRDKDARDNERLHRVRLSEYWMAKYPVTVAQYRAFLKDTDREADEDWKEYNEYDSHPVVRVSWHDANEYCKWLTEKLKERGFNWQIKLPTEAQWEKAARGTDQLIYPWGDDPDPDKMNFRDTGINTTSPVGCFPKGKSPYDCLDMAGNVWEWCADDWHGNYDAAPEDGSAWVDTPRGPYRVRRGGRWYNPAQDCRSAYRYSGALPSHRYVGLGFRVQRS
ncbi:MAG: SUMF1/EgtB/PvdO family nonheme iron enzyme [Desulfococcaceae bacterium]